MTKIFKEFKPKEVLLAAICVCFIAFQVWLDLKLPDYMGTITKLVQTPNSAMSDILENGAYMLACALGSLISSIIVAAFAAKIASNFSARIRSKFFDKVLTFSLKEINLFSTSSLITRCTNDVTQVQMLIVMGLQVMIKSPILVVWSIVKISTKSWQWSAATGVAIICLVAIAGSLLARVFPKFRIIQKLNDELNRVTREHLTGVRVVRAYNAEQYQEKNFEIANTNLTDTQFFTAKSMAKLMPTINLLMSSLTLSIYWIGAILIDQAPLMDKVSLFSDMIVFSSYAMQLLMAFMLLTMIFLIFPRASVSAKRILQVLDTKPDIIDGDSEKKQTVTQGEIEFKNVSFKYPDADEYVLKDISFSAKKGETIAFIGSTGSGKSTLINLVPRFYDVTDGEILVDGINVKEFSQNDLRQRIGFVTQKAILFSGSITSNVSFGHTQDEKISQENLSKAVSIAQASDFVEGLDDKYDSYVAQGGANFSGGQKQRLSIARAIAKNPEILIFDDSFSALDYKTDRKLRSELKNSISGTTSMIVAQRIGTIKDADKIVVLDDGEVAGIGTHEKLLQTCEVYKEIALSQLSQEELDA